VDSNSTWAKPLALPSSPMAILTALIGPHDEKCLSRLYWVVLKLMLPTNKVEDGPSPPLGAPKLLCWKPPWLPPAPIAGLPPEKLILKALPSKS
jgi:hypothetical protein